jgi:hypothetical protein
MHFEGMMHRQAVDDARMAHLARTFQRDASDSDSARLETADAGTGVRFATVAYQASKGKVVRTQEAPGAPPVSYEWPLEFADVRFFIEPAGEGPGVAWVIFTFSAPVEKGPPVERRWSLAARIGGGGNS